MSKEEISACKFLGNSFESKLFSNKHYYFPTRREIHHILFHNSGETASKLILLMDLHQVLL